MEYCTIGIKTNTNIYLFSFVQELQYLDVQYNFSNISI